MPGKPLNVFQPPFNTNVIRARAAIENRSDYDLYNMFVPDEILSLHTTNFTDKHYVDGVLMLVDIARLNEFVETYYRTRPHAFTNLNTIIDAFFATTMRIITMHSGDLLKISGTNMLVLWRSPGEQSTSIAVKNAVTCAVIITDTLRKLEGNFALEFTLRIAIARGDLYISYLGDHTHKTLLFSGEAFEVVQLILLEVDFGVICVQEAVWSTFMNANRRYRASGAKQDVTANGNVALKDFTHFLPDCVPEELMHNANLCVDDFLKHVSVMLAEQHPPSRSKFSLSAVTMSSPVPTTPRAFLLPSSTAVSFRCFVAPPILDMIDTKSPFDAYEIRELTIGYVQLILESTLEENHVQEIYGTLSDIARNNGAFVMNLLSFRTAMAFHVIFGYNKSVNSSHNALLTMSQYEKHLSTNKVIKYLFASVASGVVFCGAVGDMARKEFVIAGTPVTRTMRMVAEHSRTVVCDYKTYKRSRLPQKYFKLLHFADSEYIFEFDDMIGSENYDDFLLHEPPAQLVGREDELNLACEIILSPEAVDNYLGVCYHGQDGLGKSTFLHHLLLYTKRLPRVKTFFLDLALETKRPYFCISLFYKHLYDKLLHEMGNNLECVCDLPRDLWDLNDLLQDDWDRKEHFLYKKLRMVNHFRAMCIKFAGNVVVLCADNVQHMDFESLEILETVLKSHTPLRFMSCASFDEANWDLKFKLSLSKHLKLLEWRRCSAQEIPLIACRLLKVGGLNWSSAEYLVKIADGKPKIVRNFLSKLIHAGRVSVYSEGTEKENHLPDKGDVLKREKVVFAKITEHDTRTRKHKYKNDEFDESLSHCDFEDSCLEHIYERFDALQRDIVQIAAVVGSLFTKNILFAMLNRSNATQDICNGLDKLFDEQVFECGCLRILCKCKTKSMRCCCSQIDGHNSEETLAFQSEKNSQLSGGKAESRINESGQCKNCVRSSDNCHQRPENRIGQQSSSFKTSDDAVGDWGQSKKRIRQSCSCLKDQESYIRRLGSRTEQSDPSIRQSNSRIELTEDRSGRRENVFEDTSYAFEQTAVTVDLSKNSIELPQIRCRHSDYHTGQSDARIRRSDTPRKKGVPENCDEFSECRVNPTLHSVKHSPITIELPKSEFSSRQSERKVKGRSEDTFQIEHSATTSQESLTTISQLNNRSSCDYIFFKNASIRNIALSHLNESALRHIRKSFLTVFQMNPRLSMCSSCSNMSLNGPIRNHSYPNHARRLRRQSDNDRYALRNVWDSKLCQCIEVSMKFHARLINHALANEDVEMEIFFTLEYSKMLVSLSEYDKAIEVLTETRSILKKHKDLASWPMADLKLNLQMAECYLKLNLRVELQLVLSNFIEINRNKFLRNTEEYNRFLYIFSLALSARNQMVLATRFAIRSLWILGNAGGYCVQSTWHVCEVLSHLLKLISITGNMKLCKRINRHSPDLLRWADGATLQDFVAFSKLLYRMSEVNILFGRIDYGLHFAYKVLHINDGTSDKCDYVIQAMSLMCSVYMMKKRIHEAVHMAKRMYNVRQLFTNDQASLAYFTTCAELSIETGFVLEPMEKCLTFAHNYFTSNANKLEFNQQERRFGVLLLNYHVRNSHVLETSKWRKIANVQSAYELTDYISTYNWLKHAECLLIIWSRNVGSFGYNQYNLNQSQQQQTNHHYETNRAVSKYQVRYALNTCLTATKRWCVFAPRYMHLHAYYQQIRRNDGGQKYVKMAFETAHMYRNVAEKCWIQRSVASWRRDFDYSGVIRNVDWKYANHYDESHWSYLMYALPVA